MGIEVVSLIMFAVVCLFLLAGYPVAFSLAGTALLFAIGGSALGAFDTALLGAFPSRVYGTMTNTTLIAVPLFIFMGITLEKSKIAEELLESMAALFGNVKGGLGYSVVIVGTLLAASTGIVGATVVTMGLMSLPTMLKQNYNSAFATGTICATGTLGQIIPPSIALVLLGDILSSAYQQAQLNIGIFNPKTISVGDLFIGAVIPGLVLVGLYLAYIMFYTNFIDKSADHNLEKQKPNIGQLLVKFIPPVLLIAIVLGSILAGVATPTEAAGLGALGALLMAVVRRQLTVTMLTDILSSAAKVTSMVFMILIGAALFSLVFRAYGGDDLVHELFHGMPGGKAGALIVVMLVMFFLGFILDFIEITFVVVPIVAPILLQMGIDPLWLGIMIAVNLQTSFLTPPFGFALFYLRSVAPEEVQTTTIYKGVAPYIVIQLILLVLLSVFPELVLWLPSKL